MDWRSTRCRALTHRIAAAIALQMRLAGKIAWAFKMEIGWQKPASSIMSVQLSIVIILEIVRI